MKQYLYYVKLSVGNRKKGGNAESHTSGSGQRFSPRQDAEAKQSQNAGAKIISVIISAYCQLFIYLYWIIAQDHKNV